MLHYATSYYIASHHTTSYHILYHIRPHDILYHTNSNHNIACNLYHTLYSPTLYSQITGKYASVERKIFPHILLLCSISYSCFNGLTIYQHFIKPVQMYFVSFCSRFIDRFAPCVLFRRAMWAHQFTVTLTCTNAKETVAIDVLVVV